MSDDYPTPDEQRQRFAERLEAAGIAPRRFIDVRDGEKGTRTTGHQEAITWLDADDDDLSGNYGVHPGYGLIEFDVDDYDDEHDTEALDALPETFTVESPHTADDAPGHRYYAVDDDAVKEVLEDVAGTLNPEPTWGEVKYEGKYVVGPGSQLDGCSKEWCDECAKPDGGYYRIAEDRPLATLTADEIAEVLRADPEFADDDDADDDQQAASEVFDLPPEDDDGDESDEWPTEADVREALTYIDPDVGNDKWVRIGYALGGYFDDSTALDLYEEWSRGGESWDDEAERRAPDIIDRADPGGPATIATVVGLAKAGGWNLSTCPSAEAGRAERQEEATDGGTVMDASDDSATLTGGERTLEEQIEDILLAYESDDGMPQRAVIHRAANAITAEYDFVHPPEDADAWRSVLYRYDEAEGVYVPDGERFVAEIGEELLGEFLTNTQTNELAGKIKRRSGVDSDELETPPHRLVVGNGILDLRSGEVDPWTPDEYHRTKTNVEYHPDAECPRIDEFFRSIVKPRDVPTLYQLAAHSLYKEYVGEKAAMLVGDGKNGKSVFLDLLERFLGGANVSHRSLQDLDGQQFAANNLEGKLANFHPDMEDENVQNLGLFKQLTGRDTVTGDVKFEKPIDFENYATMIFSANRIPAMDEDTYALWRRWIYLKFPNTFEKGGEDYQEKDELMAELTTESELEGLLARCVEEIKEWDDGREWFTNIDNPEQVREKMKRASEPIYNFATVCLERDDDNSIPKEMVRKCYRQYAREEDLPTIPANQFGKKVVNIRDFPIETGQPRIDGEQVHAYTGVRFTSRGRQVLGLDEADDGAQTAVDADADGGPQGRRDTVTEAVKDLDGGDEPVKKDMVIGYVVGHGLTKEQAERAWNQLVKRGALWNPADAADDEYMLA